MEMKVELMIFTKHIILLCILVINAVMAGMRICTGNMLIVRVTGLNRREIK